MHTRDRRVSRAGTGTLSVLALAGGLALAGCDAVLDVDNPNALIEDELDNPLSSRAIVNGTLAVAARAHSWVLTEYSTVTDELRWVGSRDAYRQLMFGNVSDPRNEFTDASFPFIGEARWMTDEAVARLEAFRDAGDLARPSDVAWAYLLAGIVSSTIPDMYDDFTLSDRDQAGPPVGEMGMVQFYDRAVAHLDKGVAWARENALTAQESQLLAARARAKHGRAVWHILNPAGQTPADPLVHDAGATADAQAALALIGGADWDFRYQYSANTITSNIGAWVNERLEMRVGDAYVSPTANNLRVASVAIRDPIDDVVDPVASRVILEFVGNRQFGPLTVLSARELHLIVAEGALAQGDEQTFAEHVNAVRELDGLTPWSGQIPALDMLKHARQVNLFLQGRRLQDHYRFGDRAAEWLPTSDAFVRPGTFFPITNVERVSNCHLLGSC